MFEGVTIGVAATLLAAILIALGATMIRLWHTPKRVDRLERLFPTMARALLVLLQRHVNDETDSEAEKALKELNIFLTDGAVSQKVSK